MSGSRSQFLTKWSIFASPRSPHPHNITLILKRRAKVTCEAIPSARAFALLVCGELSDRDPPMCCVRLVGGAFRCFLVVIAHR
jgi:hypothetical protein